MPSRFVRTLSFAALLAGTTLHAHAGFVFGNSINGQATDNFVETTIFNGNALIGPGVEFVGTQDLAGILVGWTADFGADSVTLEATPNRGVGVGGFFGPRYTFSFTGIALMAGIEMSDLEFVSASNLDLGAVMFGVDSLTINISSFDTRNADPLTASVTYAFRSAQVVPEPGSLALAGLGIVAMTLAQRRRRGASRGVTGV